MRYLITPILASAVIILGTPTAQAQPGWIQSHQKINDTEGGFAGTPNDANPVGISIASLSDLDRDGVVSTAALQKLQLSLGCIETLVQGDSNSSIQLYLSRLRRYQNG